MSVHKNWSFKSRRVQGKWCHLLARLSIHVILSLCACFTFNQGLKGVFFLSFFFSSNYLLHNSIWKQGTKTVRSFCLGFLISQVMWQFSVFPLYMRLKFVIKKTTILIFVLFFLGLWTNTFQKQYTREKIIGDKCKIHKCSQINFYGKLIWEKGFFHIPVIWTRWKRMINSSTNQFLKESRQILISNNVFSPYFCTGLCIKIMKSFMLVTSGNLRKVNILPIVCLSRCI